MGWVDSTVKKTQKQGEAVVEKPVDMVGEKAGINWNPMKTVHEDLSNPGSGAYGAYQDATGNVSNAYHTSVIDPINGAVKGGKDFLAHLQDMYNNAKNGLQVPGGPGGMAGMLPGGGIQAPTMPGGGAGGGGFTPVTIGGGAAGYNQAQDPFRNAQMGLLSQLQGQANGQGPSIAQNQLKLGQESALAQNIAMANSGRGGANPLMARNALQTNAMQGGAMANQAANLRLQEQQQAQAALGGLTGQGRQGDFAQQQLAQQGQIAQGQINQQGQQQSAELAAKYAAMGMTAQQANQQAAIDMMKLQQEGGLGYANLGLQSQIAQNALLGNTLQGAGGVLAGLGSISDRRAKKDIKKADGEIREFLSALSAESYEYKNKSHGEGRFVSPMAQDLMKTPIGRSMVEKTPDGILAVNYGRGLGAILAAQASLNKRLDEIEESK